MLDTAKFVSLAPHALVIGVIIFAGLLASSVVGGLLGWVPVLGELGALLAETLRLTGIVTAVLYAVRAA